MQLRDAFDEFTRRNAVILATGPDDEHAFKRFWHRHHIPFVGLPDPSHEVADRYGQEVKLLKFGRMPALLIVDPGGLIRYRHHADSMADIPPNRELLAVLDALPNEQQSQPVSD